MIYCVFRYKKIYGIFLIVLSALLVLVAAASLFLGTANIRYGDVFRILLHHIPGMENRISMDGIPDSAVTIIVKLRLTRVILAMLVGAGLAAVGSTMQCLFRNPMAEPGLLGISSGAGLGATIAIVIGANTTFFGMGSAAIAAFVGAMSTILVVYNISRTGSKISPTVLILAGTAVSFMNSAIIQLIMVFRRDRMDYIILWTMGSFTTSGWNKILILFPFLVIGITILLLYARQLNVISTGEETAQSLGIEVEKVKKILLAVCSMITAACVSTSGIIGFVGLIIPHVFRLVVGSDQRILLPYSIVGGAAFLVICDTLARIIAPPAEIPVGAITAVFGSPFFIALLIRSKRSVM
ncbi:iron ABC transporter permease [Thermoclostridium stercorarium]|uniref:FecCD family ABC transporter permease n=1 Tax=Thermoclostridium stercorarium TaxID=1510 RepID=UPI002249342B|nr:iron ABC transporter permease [Thermoclostridium stercorarium]UZQ85155.1 iron ABC transporter permease [Thermoclostridium stercorarium]